MTEARRRLFLCLMSLLLLPVTGMAEARYLYEPLKTPLNNPLMGLVVWAEDLSEHPQPFSLVYANITWAEWEPEEGFYDVEALEETYHLAWWRSQGKHVILRFVMDIPGESEHADLPSWLLEKVGGTAYDISYGKGFCPDYSDPVLQQAHARAIRALGAQFDADSAVAFLELGSLGHWGEWHVHEDAGEMPEASVREKYVMDYVEAFPSTHLLVRRPFRFAGELGMGLFNDAAGDVSQTLVWLDWIENGGAYLGEEGALAAMSEGWKTGPIGGELTTGVTSEDLLRGDEETLTALFRLSHTSWIGPNSFSEVDDEALQDTLDTLMAAIGYRLLVTECRTDEATICLTMGNLGIAPFYYDWPVVLRFGGEEVEELTLPLRLPDLLPGQEMTVSVPWPEGYEGEVWIGILDPMTGQAAVSLAMKTEVRDGWHLLVP